MSATQRPQRTFLGVTMITVIAITTVFLAYAAILATYTGGNVVVNQPGGDIQYNLSNTSNSTWTNTLTVFNGTAWYARINITNSGAQTVGLDWHLIMNSADQGIKVTTSNYQLSGGTNTIYATTDGLFANNYNWGQDTGTGGTYNVRVVVNG